MKKMFTLLVLVMTTLAIQAQLQEPITFEQGLVDTLWTPFANGSGTADDFKVVENPSKSGINTSDSVLLFNVAANADPWVGAWSDYYSEIEITETEHTISMMVLKTISSPVHLKLEQSTNGGSNVEVADTNQLTDQWELLEFDMSAAKGFNYKRLTFFPDFPGTRTGGTTVYIDNIANGTATRIQQASEKTLVMYPNPVVNRLYVEYPQMKEIRVLNMLGQTVKSISFEAIGKKTIELGDLSRGMYILSLETDGGKFTAKFFKN